MDQTRALLSCLCLLAVTGPAVAATIVQCEDADGNRTFEASCPPGTTQVEKKSYYTGPKDTAPDLETLKAERPVVLYRVPTCEACDAVSNYLDNRGTPYSEKNVSDDAELQEELLSISGELSVPVVTVGEEMVAGYNRPMLSDKLDAAGYPSAEDEGTESASR
ncbi:glutaredoxin [Methylohalomonas lacus]|uniref:Glutaredoxin n=1 Tax=Methylohalomonas lacus TaxID=398773 RepID=A0AAE3HL65_9GAMM|nr:glutaredoxin family protein [Methylohalomonas lacus]MCS3902992.1 glutaredoxin [Methylohalomonas lacus]